MNPRSVPISFDRNGLLCPDNIIDIDDYTHIEPPCAISAGAIYQGKHIGAFSHSWSYLPRSVKSLGRYTSIAANNTFYLHDHPISNLVLSSCSYNSSSDFIWGMHESKKGVQPAKALAAIQDLDGTKSTIIDNDVWIGHSCFVKPGVRIHTGAVVAAFSVVTKDIPPYAIVAGNPARIKKFRFPPDIIQELLLSKWWRYDYTDLLLNNIDLRNPLGAVDAIKGLAAQGVISEYNPFRIYEKIS